MTNSQLARGLAAAVAIIVILGFAVLYGRGIVECWLAPADKLPSFGAQYVYVATALAGLVGGVVAMVFNDKLPDAALQKKNLGETASEATPSASGSDASLKAIRGSFSPSSADILQAITAVYAIVYFVAGFASIVTWIKISDPTPDLIKNLALISIGLFVAIARSFFTVPPPSST